MRSASERTLVDWWSRVFDVDPRVLWRSVTVRPHRLLADYSGCYVAWRGQGLHVSAPEAQAAPLSGILRDRPTEELAGTEAWRDIAEQLGLTVIGPATHTYLDADPGPSPDVVEVDEAELDQLCSTVPADDWKESGWSDEPSHRFGLRIHGKLAAAANLNNWDGTPRDIGVLVAPGHRGRGLGAVVGRSAASYAIARHGLARWSARSSNVASLGGAARLGFEPWATQLAMR